MIVQLMPLQKYTDRRGELTALDDPPFHVKRVFCVSNVPLEEVRGGHAHKKCNQFLVAVCGAVLITMGDGKSFVLDKPTEGLLVPHGYLLWYRFLTDNTTLLVLCSEKYDTNDYIEA